MDRRDFLRCASTAAAASVATRAMGWAEPTLQNGAEATVKDLGEVLEAIRNEHGLPGIAAAAVRGDGLVAEGVAGVRRVGEDDKITLDDRFALASCTKRMTAAMIARVIDSGRLSFDTTLADALPEMPMRDDYRNVTVAQLLTFSGGIQPYTLFNRMRAPILFELKGSAAEQREQFIKHLLLEEPVVRPGTERRYSNASYALVAYVAERWTGKSWETLMETEVFQPLGMTTAGFGRPRTKERPNEPSLHSKGQADYEAEADDRLIVMAALAPAGDVHCSIRDFAKFAAYELNAAKGNDSLLRAATAQRWQELSRMGGPPEGKGKKTKTPSEGGVPQPGKKVVIADGKLEALGGRPFFGGSAFISTGCVVWPDITLAAVVAVNAGGAGDGVREALQAVKARFEK
jgi:CubicO group peptidase (beta-lactamase class C family)